MSYPCPTGCGRMHSWDRVMCGPCWKRVPVALQRAVYRAWNARQDDPGDEGKVTAHEAAKEAAVRSVTR